MFFAPLVLSLATSTAHAEDPSCASFSSTQVAEHAADARAALFDDDLARLSDNVAQVEAQVECLSDVVPPFIWAGFLVTMSIAAYAENEDWQSPLQSAINADPTVSRVVGEGHPISSWTPPPYSAEDQTPLPRDVKVYLDGRMVRFMPALFGPHLVQIKDGKKIHSSYFADAVADEVLAWVGAYAEEEPHPVVVVPAPIPDPIPVEVTTPDLGGSVADGSHDDGTLPGDDQLIDEGVVKRKRKGKAVLGAGGAMMGASVAVIGITKGMADSREVWELAQVTGLKAGNTVGWSMGIAGAAMGALGMVILLDGGHSTAFLPTPNGLMLNGSF